MNRKKKNQDTKQKVIHLLTHAHDDSGGTGQAQKPGRSARFSSEPAPQKDFTAFWKHLGSQVNDNAGARKKTRYARVAGFALILVTGLSMNRSALVTQAVLHADDALLSAAMEASPEALGYVLNGIDVGE